MRVLKDGVEPLFWVSQGCCRPSVVILPRLDRCLPSSFDLLDSIPSAVVTSRPSVFFKCCFTSTDTDGMDFRDVEPRMSTEIVRTVRDGEPRTSTETVRTGSL